MVLCISTSVDRLMKSSKVQFEEVATFVLYSLFGTTRRTNDPRVTAEAMKPVETSFTNSLDEWALSKKMRQGY